MPYNKTTWVQNDAPYINADNLNNIEDGLDATTDASDLNTINIDILAPQVEQNTTDISALVSGETLQGVWTPTAGNEYPPQNTVGYSWYISGVPAAGYLFTGGDLVGQTTMNQDKIIITVNGMSLVSNNLTSSIENMTIGNINNPLLDIPLNGNLAIKQGTGEVEFTRASTATYIDMYGVLQTAAIDEPRFEKDGLLIEGSTTNLYYPSNTGVPTRTTAQVGTLETVDPYGTNLATKLTATATAGSHYMANNVLNLPIDTIFTQTVFAKRGSYDFVFVGGAGVVGSTGVTVDLSDGSVGYNTALSHKVTPMANGWYKISATVQATSAISNAGLYMPAMAASKDSTGSASWTPLGTEYFYVYGLQVEENPFGTSYVQTLDAEVERAYDYCNATYYNNFPLAGGVATILCDINTVSTTTNSYAWRIEGETSRHGFIYNGSTYYSTLGTTNDIYSNDFSNTSRAVTRYTELLVESGALGVMSGTPLTGTLPTGLAESITIGSQTRYGGLALHGNIKNFRVYDKALTDEEIRLA